MLKIPRIYNDLDNYFRANKALIIYGARQIGKTTLIKNYLETTSYKYKFVTGDNIETQDVLSVPDLIKLQDYISGYQLLVIDEAQKVKNIAEVMKLLLDHIPGLIIIATGSSSFELVGQVGEPLTGRKTTLTLFPIAQVELAKLYNNNKYELAAQLENTLIYGSYPEVITADSVQTKRENVTEIMQSYLLKDILSLDRIKGSKFLLDLLRLIAFQLGNQVSLSELAQVLAVDAKTVARYLEILEKSFVLYNLRGFSRNLRKEISKKSKYYFYDTGIRNAIIANFNPLVQRNDIGALWENFIIIERIKKQHYQKIYSNNYFWRTWEQQEIDFVEERDGKLFGFEIKWQQENVAAPSQWLQTYDNAEFTVINKSNFLDFIM